MRRLGTLGLAFLAVLVLGSAASSSASAAKCEKKVGSKHYIVCVNGEKLGSTSSELMTSAIKSGTKAKLGFFTGYVPVACTSEDLGVSGGSGFPTLKNNGSGSAVLTGGFDFGGCALQESEAKERGCTTQKTMEWKRMTGNFGSSGATTFTPDTGSYVTYHVSGEGCPASFSGNFAITGSPQCTLTNMETETLSKELVCTGSKSLFFQAAWGNVTFQSESVLETLGPVKKPFSVVEG
jgi:hypothetical protein